MGYGPVCKNGYGCSYNIQKKKIIFCLGSFNTSEYTDIDCFICNLEESLLSIQKLLKKVKPKKKKKC